MYRYLACFVFCLACGLAITCAGQTAPQPAAAKPDYSKEAFVDEEDSTKIVFENDGTGTREALNRVRIQSDAGVQRFGVLTFAYQSAAETIEIDYVRVRKPDGSTVTTPSDNIQDMPTEITRQAPFYSDLREKHVAVKGLSAGDVLEYHVSWRENKPLAPGQFWYGFNFPHDYIVLHQEVQISVPRDRPVKWKSPSVKPVINEDGIRRVFTWTSSQTEDKSSEQQKKEQEETAYETARGKLPPPDVEISSFQNWNEVGAWYNSLQLERVKPSEEIRAKAAELTKNATDETAKLQAIYNYVSTQFHYIGVAFGIGRYQPHSAAEVLGNQYGDCKDKHTLLASLLAAAGIKAYPALINTFRDLDPDVPSPGQFDHVITAVAQGNGYLWLDTTAEVAPFGYLIGVLRNKPALVIPPEAAAALVTTVADPPAKAAETFKIDAKLNDDGTLEGKVERTVTNDDSEVLLRSAFRRLPMPQWKDLTQQISYASGFAGDVSEVTASAPEKTGQPFRFSYSYNRKDYPQWSERRISSPLPPMLAPAPDPQPSHPIILGPIADYNQESRVELPKGYAPQLPEEVNLKEDFADYHAAYSFNNGVLQTVRSLNLKLAEVPPNEYEAYKKFSKAVTDDHEVYVALSSGGTPPSPLQQAVMNLPASANPDAMSEYGDAITEIRSGNVTQAIDALNKAVRNDPKFTRAWLLLSQLYAGTGKKDMTLETLDEAYRADPHQPVLWKALTMSLEAEKKYDKAVSILQNVAKNEPSNVDALSMLGGALLNLKRYADAASALESAVKLAPDRAGLYAQLGSAYLRSGNDDKSTAAYKKALDMDPRPGMYNDIGYEMADANRNLPLALTYTEQAVKEEEQASSKVDLSELKMDDLQHPSRLAAYWDSLGWAHFRLGHLDEAEKYVLAAWELWPQPVVADHLNQVRKEQHNSGALPDSNLIRTTKLPHLVEGTASAEFFVILSRDPANSGVKVDDVTFISGSEKLRSSTKTLSTASFKFPFPDDGPTHLVRRGILGCYQYTGCSFVLYNPGDVHSVN